MDKTLEDLSLSHFRLFCSKLLREDLLRERQSTVSALAADHDFTEITGLLVSTFTEDGALSVAPGTFVETKRKPKLLTIFWKCYTRVSVSVSTNYHLIHVMSNVEPILDELLTKGVIEQESFDKISALPTSEEKMMELLDDHLKTVGDKDIFYNIIEKWLFIKCVALPSLIEANVYTKNEEINKQNVCFLKPSGETGRKDHE
uniref:CARD domain-containing protein n=1 Tax=Sander lucioperca TaxID=283035 RepID=A0A8C9XX57_SANLU